MKASVAAIFLSAAALANQATAGESDVASLLRQQIIPCWTILPGMENPAHAVTLTIKLNRDGSVDGTPETVENNAGPALSGSARRAVLKCQPYRLPPEQYRVWKEVKITFRAEP